MFFGEDSLVVKCYHFLSFKIFKVLICSDFIYSDELLWTGPFKLQAETKSISIIFLH